MLAFTVRSLALGRTAARPAIASRALARKPSMLPPSKAFAKSFPAFQTRTYADDPSKASGGATTRGEAQASTNIHDTPSADTNSSKVNKGRGAEAASGAGGGDTGSLAQPISNPDQAGLGAQEEQQPSSENMRSDPKEPDHVKRERVEQEGQKPLDPADK